MLPKELKSQIDILDEELDVDLKLIDLARHHTLLLDNMIKNGNYNIDLQLYLFKNLEFSTEYISTLLKKIDRTSNIRRLKIEQYLKYGRV